MSLWTCPRPHLTEKAPHRNTSTSAGLWVNRAISAEEGWGQHIQSRGEGGVCVTETAGWWVDSTPIQRPMRMCKDVCAFIFLVVYTALLHVHPALWTTAAEELQTWMTLSSMSAVTTVSTHRPTWVQAPCPPGPSWGHDLTHQWEGLTFGLRTTRQCCLTHFTMHLPRRSWSSNPLRLLQWQKGGKRCVL